MHVHENFCGWWGRSDEGERRRDDGRGGGTRGCQRRYKKGENTETRESGERKDSDKM
jgi:hypothetical protein